LTVELPAAPFADQPQRCGTRKLLADPLNLLVLHMADQREVVWAVISLDAITVVDQLITPQVTTNDALNDEAVLTHIAGLRGEGMRRGLYQYIPVLVEHSATSPASVAFHRIRTLEPMCIRPEESTVLVAFDKAPLPLTRQLRRSEAAVTDDLPATTATGSL
jgi:hypothetical protein